MIVRGATNLPITIGDFAIPNGARMNLMKTQGSFSPVEWVPIAQIPTGNGLLFMHTLSVQSGNMVGQTAHCLLCCHLSVAQFAGRRFLPRAAFHVHLLNRF